MNKPESVSISQGEFAVSGKSGAVISTILGSCVAVCLWDDTAGVGGMNHILVAQSNVGGIANDFAGVNAMELLINALVREGAMRTRLKAKVFGGARMVRGLSDIGHANGAFALKFLDQEGIPCIGNSLGGSSARHIRFYPAEGRVMQKTVASAPEPTPAVKVPARNDVELF
ncbi:chemotaxis protein CheD [Pseudooceanicola onchidii]|uniref:chemotaxis protein CheD n=1 Tax=Pseudooceanicola onchidii TaxID=2562279 RepID=UPI0010AAC851|nr:chemotaxis protein CheD [Pseudooceanicola onchidii]